MPFGIGSGIRRWTGSGLIGLRSRRRPGDWHYLGGVAAVTEADGLEARPRTPLSVVILALLAEEPMHPYRMQALIKFRAKDRVVNVAQRNSVYQTIDRLLRSGLIAVHSTDRAESRPERTLYAITALGEQTLRRWLQTMLAE